MTRCSLPLLALILLATGCAQDSLSTVRAGHAKATLQAPTDASFEPWLRGERDRVALLREAAQQRYHDDELACWRRFAVNDCVREAKRQRRDTLDALRQQELQLNALERERRTAGRLRAIEQKVAPSAPVAAPSVQGRQ